MIKILTTLTLFLATPLLAVNCPWGNEPVCGVDYITYPNQCALAAAYVELQHLGPCTQVKNEDGLLESDCP